VDFWLRTHLGCRLCGGKEEVGRGKGGETRGGEKEREGGEGGGRGGF